MWAFAQENPFWACVIAGIVVGAVVDLVRGRAKRNEED